MKNILIINAHQKWEGMSEGALNERFENEIQSFFKNKDFDIQTTKIEEGYDIDEEVNKHDWADIVITQTPVFWFNTPWIHKKYIDEVFTFAWMQQKLLINDGRQQDNPNKQYGTGGTSQGKKFMISATWNAPKEAFYNKDQFLLEGKSPDEALINVTNNYKFCGFDILEGFYAFDVVKNPQINQDLELLNVRLNEIILN